MRDELDLKKETSSTKNIERIAYLFVVNVAKSNVEPFDIRIGSTRAARKEQK